MKLKLIAIAALAALSASGAFAEEGGGIENGRSAATILNTTEVSNYVEVEGRARVWGGIEVNAESSAVVDSGQRTEHNDVTFGRNAHNSAEMNGNVLEKAAGNIGVNVSAGAGNAQSNDAALAAVDAKKVFASAMDFNKQHADGNTLTLDPKSASWASMGGTALKDAKGNIGVNIAAGAGNAQENALAASTNSSGTIAKATIDNEQSANGNKLRLNSSCEAVDPLNAAGLGGSALAGAQGNIGVNIAAGVGNLQHNGLSIATATSMNR